MTKIVDDRDACTSSLHDTAPPRHRAAPTAATTRADERNLVGDPERPFVTRLSIHMALTRFISHQRTIWGVMKIISSSVLSLRSLFLNSHPSKGIRCNPGVRLLRWL